MGLHFFAIIAVSVDHGRYLLIIHVHSDIFFLSFFSGGEPLTPYQMSFGLSVTPGLFFYKLVPKNLV